MNDWVNKRRSTRLQRKADILRKLKAKDSGWDVHSDLTESNGWNSLFGMALLKDDNAVWKTWSAKQLEQLHAKCDLIFTCVRTLCQAFSEASARVVRVTDEGEEDLPQHWLSHRLRHPNPLHSELEFEYNWLMHLLYTGYSYVMEVKNNGNQIIELVPLPTSWVTPATTYDDFTGYRVWWGKNQEPLTVPEEDMWVTLSPDPTNFKKGVGPVQALRRNIQIEGAREDYLVEMLENLSVPGLVVKQEDEWTDEQKIEARQIIRDRVGKGKRGSPLFVYGQNSGVDVLAPLKDIDWPSLSSLTESRICAAFGVPAIVAGVRVGLEHATYSNYGIAEKVLYRRPVSAAWSFFDAAGTRALLHDEGEPEDLQVKHDLTKVKQLKADQKEIREDAIEKFHAGAITRDRMLELMDEEPVGGELGEQRVIPANLRVVVEGMGEEIDLGEEDDDKEWGRTTEEEPEDDGAEEDSEAEA